MFTYYSYNYYRPKAGWPQLPLQNILEGSSVSSTILALITVQWNHRCSCTMTKINTVPTWLILKPPTVIKAVFQMSIKKGFCNHYKWRFCIVWERRSWDRQKEKHPAFWPSSYHPLTNPPCWDLPSTQQSQSSAETSCWLVVTTPRLISKTKSFNR